jgi:ribosomal protein L27
VQSNSSSAVVSKDITSATINSGQFGKLGLIGKIFDRHEADVLFGEVKNSVSISVDDLNAALDKGKDYILFTIKDNQVVIRNETRQHLSNERVKLGKDETLYIFSKSMVKNLLKEKKVNKGINSSMQTGTVATNDDAVTVEVRDGVITLTYNDITLEHALPCPPFCD